MNTEEFLNFLNSSQEEIEVAKIHEAKFVESLSKELFNFIFEHFPAYEPYLESVSIKLKELCNNSSKMVIEGLNSAFYKQERNLPYTKSSIAPKIKTREESQKELQEFTDELKEMTEVTKEDREYLDKTHWEDYEHEIKHQQFHKGIHDKTKEILVDFYEDDILELKGDYLRLLDNYTYNLAIYPFIDGVYELLSKVD